MTNVFKIWDIETDQDLVFEPSITDNADMAYEDTRFGVIVRIEDASDWQKSALIEEKLEGATYPRFGFTTAQKFENAEEYEAWLNEVWDEEREEYIEAATQAIIQRIRDLQEDANALDEPVSTLATVQATYISAKEKLELYMAADPELAKLRDAASDAKNAVDMARQRVITKALEAFAANPDERQVHPNVEIKMMTTFDYELADATEWARENARYLLRLDTKAFERSVKSMDAPPACVTVSKEPKPFIDRDLNGNS